LIVNGDFETPLVGSGHRPGASDWDYFTPDSSAKVGGWTVEITGNDGGPPGPDLEFWSDLGPMPTGSAYSGKQCVELDGFDPTKISQVVSTLPGVRYELTYAWRPRIGQTDRMKVWVDGVEVGDHSGPADIWTVETYPFTASSSSTTIAFAEVGADDQFGMLLDDVGLVSVSIEVDIDIKPGSDPNPINPGSKGLVPVAILSSAEFDATQVDPTSVSLAGATVAVRGKGTLMAHEEDVNGDSLADLVVQVETQGFADLGEGGTVALTGETFGGQAIVGYDEIIIVPPEE
jgi:hypothetical protein